jgi:hypothetical protein
MATNSTVTVLILVAAAVLACAGGARGFYLPGVAPADFRKVSLSLLFFLFFFLCASILCVC